MNSSLPARLAIRLFPPDALVVSAWKVKLAIGLNQPDYRCNHDAANRWVFRELLDEGHEPHPTLWFIRSKLRIQRMAAWD